MKAKDHQSLIQKLMENYPDDHAPGLRADIEKMFWDDLDRIEPLIDDMLEQAERRGMLQAYIEIIAAQQEYEKTKA